MWNVFDVHAGMAVFFLQLCAKMCAKVQMSKILHVHLSAKFVWCACRCCNWSLFAKSYENVCKSVVLQLEFFCNYACKSKISHMCKMYTCKMCVMCMQVLQLCVQKCGCAKFCTFTHVRNVCLFYHCFVTNCQNTGEPICLFTYIQNCQDCSERNCFINQNQLQFDFKLWFKLIWLNFSFISELLAWLIQGRNPKNIDCNLKKKS